MIYMYLLVFLAVLLCQSEKLALIGFEELNLMTTLH